MCTKSCPRVSKHYAGMKTMNKSTQEQVINAMKESEAGKKSGEKLPSTPSN